jgi:hypothetical protein
MYQTTINTFLKLRKAVIDGTLDPTGADDDADVTAAVAQAPASAAGTAGRGHDWDAPSPPTAPVPEPLSRTVVDKIVTASLDAPRPWADDGKLRNKARFAPPLPAAERTPTPRDAVTIDVNGPTGPAPEPPPPGPSISAVEPAAPSRPNPSAALETVARPLVPAAPAPLADPATAAHRPADSLPLSSIAPRSNVRRATAGDQAVDSPAEPGPARPGAPPAPPPPRDALQSTIERLRAGERETALDRPPPARQGWATVPPPFRTGYADYERYERVLQLHFAVRTPEEFRAKYGCEPP